jgi:hypothetical protein
MVQWRPPHLTHPSTHLPTSPACLQTGECWLKYQKDWDNNVDRAATNLRVNRRGKYPPEFRQEHKTSPGAPPAAPRTGWREGRVLWLLTCRLAHAACCMLHWFVSMALQLMG